MKVKGIYAGICSSAGLLASIVAITGISIKDIVDTYGNKKRFLHYVMKSKSWIGSWNIIIQ